MTYPKHITPNEPEYNPNFTLKNQGGIFSGKLERIFQLSSEISQEI
jgi:hypothetical protein